MNSGFVRCGMARIYYEETGDGRPVLFAHAGVTDRRMWDPLFDDPVPGHRYVRSDMRGFGKSEWIPEAYSPHDDLIAVMEALDLNDAVLVGCCMGGRAVMEVAIAAPDRVAALVVIGAGTPGWEPPDGWYTPPQYKGSEKLFEAGEWGKAAELDADVWGVGVGRRWEDTDPAFLAKIIEMDIKPVSTEYERRGGTSE